MKFENQDNVDLSKYLPKKKDYSFLLPILGYFAVALISLVALYLFQRGRV